MASETVEILRKAKALIDAPEKWSKRFAAANAAGAMVLPTHREARRFCALGAIARAQKADYILAGPVVTAFRSGAALGSRPISSWNDAPGTTHADVMAAFDRAIELASKQEA